MALDVKIWFMDHFSEDEQNGESLFQFGLLVSVLSKVETTCGDNYSSFLCNLQFFSELITTQLRFSHGVTASCLHFTYPPHHAKLQVLSIISPVISQDLS